MIELKNKHITFEGYYQGLIKSTHSFHKFPKREQISCFYADSLMLKIFDKVFNKRDLSKIKLTLEQNDRISLEADIDYIRKFIPGIVKFFKGKGFELDDKLFWKMLNNKDIQRIRYSVTPKNISKIYYKARDYNMPKKANMLDIIIEDLAAKKVDKKLNKFKKTLYKIFLKKEDREWLDDFFAKVKDPTIS